MLHSDFKQLGQVKLPYAGRQKYMHTIDLANPVMCEGFEDYLDVVKTLCNQAGAARGFAHVTIDEKIVMPGRAQRRPKPHVDGCFIPTQAKWGHGGWAHSCNNISLNEFKRMPVIVAASEVGCRAWRGTFDTQPKSDGDLSHLELGEGFVFKPNVGYLLSADCVHESMIQSKTIRRSFLRIALPTDFKSIFSGGL